MRTIFLHRPAPAFGRARRRALLLAVGAALAAPVILSGCTAQGQETNQGRQATREQQPSPGGRPAPLLARYDLSGDAGIREHLPRVLEEVSGLATAPDGRVFAHHDEAAVVYQVDPFTGDVPKAFAAGIGGMPGDFEGMAIVGDRFFLSTSRGELVEITEGADGSGGDYRYHRTGLGEFCELEGLAYDAAQDELLMPCKEPWAPDLEDHVVVFALPLQTLRPYRIPRVFVPLDELERFDLDPEFSPSAIEVHPETGGLLLLAAREEAILELSPTGALVDGRELKRKEHPQPEGIAILPDGTLLIADEGQGKRGRITRYDPLTSAPTPGAAGEGGS